MPEDLIVVAGAGGFIGGHLIDLFRRRGGVRLRAVDIKPFSEWYQCFGDVENLKLDLRERDACYEACADACARGRQLKFDDKLVYELAYKEYQKATRDPGYRDLGTRRMEYVRPSIPTKGDRFMHQDQDKSKMDCHKWIY